MDGDDFHLNDEETQNLAQWRQGDYSCVPGEFVSILASDSSGNLEYEANPNILGVVVISQTCDVVRCVPGKEYVVVAPIVELPENKIPFVRSGATPTYAALEHPPTEAAVVDLSRMLSVHKKALASWPRSDGFSDNAKLARFAGALERKHGRFAFPDAFADQVISPLRDKFKKPHGKASESGKIVRSLNHVRVQAAPAWDAELVKIGFRFVLEDTLEAPYTAIAKFIGDILKGIALPQGFAFEDPKFTLRNLDGYSAREWTSSQRIDWDYISGR